MISLAIGAMNQVWLNLQGGALMPGLVGALYEPASSLEPQVEEKITLTLKGTHAEIDAFLQRLETRLGLANRYTRDGVGSAQYLRVKAHESGLTYYAQILTGNLSADRNSLAYYASGSLGVDLVLTRNNYFDSDEIQIMLAELPSEGVNLVNHLDSNSSNCFQVDEDSLSTELPAPVRLEITNTCADGLLKDLLIGSFQQAAFDTLPQLVYEAEQGTGGITQSSSTASNGAFQRFTWSDAGWSSLTNWTITAENLAAWRGRPLCPVLRFANPHSYNGLLMKLSLTSGGITLFEGEEVPVPPGRGYYLFPPLNLPAGALPGLAYPHPQNLCLQVYKEGTSSMVLDLDDLLFVPQDSFSHHLGLVPLSQDDRFLSDSFLAISYAIQSDYELRTHINLGSGHFVRAGHSARFLIFQGDNTNAAPIDRSISVRAWYRCRRRVL